MNNLKLICFCSVVFVATAVKAQKSLLTYHFVFEKTFLEKKSPDASFLADNSLDKIPFVLHDNKKADYVLMDKNFKVESKFTADLKNTVFNEYDEKYLGGSGLPGNSVYHFVYNVTTYKYYGLFSKTSHYYKVESVDFNSKTVSQKDLMELPKEEKELISFSNYGSYYSITTNDNTGELIIYNLKGNGDIVKKNIPLTIPAGQSKSRDKLSEYLGHIKLVKDDEEVGLETATQSAKLFDYKDKMVMVVNDAASPTHIISIEKATLEKTEKFIDHSSIFSAGEKEKSYANSFLSGDKIFSLILNKKNIQVAVYDAANGNLLKKQEINEANMATALAQSPMAEVRKGNDIKDNDVTDFSKLVKALTKGTEGLMVTKNASGQFIVTIGTYDYVPETYSTGGSYHSNFSSAPGENAIAMGSVYLNTTYTPGVPIYTTGIANSYKSTSFKLILDPVNLNIAKGKLSESVNDQIKNYMEEATGKHIASKQFSIGDKQYHGYYDKDSEAYFIENIAIRKR